MIGHQFLVQIGYSVKFAVMGLLFFKIKRKKLNGYSQNKGTRHPRLIIIRKKSHYVSSCYDISQTAKGSNLIKCRHKPPIKTILLKLHLLFIRITFSFSCESPMLLVYTETQKSMYWFILDTHYLSYHYYWIFLCYLSFYKEE